VSDLVFDVLSLSSANTLWVGTLEWAGPQAHLQSHRIMDFFRNSEVGHLLPLRHEFSNLVPYRFDSCSFRRFVQPAGG
jgi:hypothetical protein